MARIREACCSPATSRRSQSPADPRSRRHLGGQPASASALSGCSSVLGASHSLPHLRHLRKSPRVLLNFISAPTKPHSGYFSFTGLFHATKSQSSLEHA